MTKKLILLFIFVFSLNGCMQEEKSWSVSSDAAYLLVYSDENSLSLSPAEFHYYDAEGHFLEMHKSIYSGIWLDTVNDTTLFLAGGNNQLLAYDFDSHQITEYSVQGEIDSMKANEDVVVYHTTYNGKYSSQFCRFDLDTTNTQCIDSESGAYVHSLIDHLWIAVSFDGSRADIFDYDFNLIKSLNLNEIQLLENLPFILKENSLYHPVNNQRINDYFNTNNLQLSPEGILGLNSYDNQSSLFLQSFQTQTPTLIYTWDYPIEFHTSACNQQIALLGKHNHFELEFLDLNTFEFIRIKEAKTKNLKVALHIKKSAH